MHTDLDTLVFALCVKIDEALRANPNLRPLP